MLAGPLKEERMNKHLVAALAILALSGSAGAAVPEGDGSVSLGLGVHPAQEMAFYSNGDDYVRAWSFDESLKGDLPLGAGFSAGLQAGFSQDTTIVNEGPGSHAQGDTRLYSLGAALNAYPAAFAHKAFLPGVNANADGWLLWPSLSVGYGWSNQDEGFTTTWNHGWRFYTEDHDLTYSLTLPLHTWLTLAGSYTSNEAEHFFDTWPGDGGYWMHGQRTTTHLGLTGYVDLAHGAGADASRPFVPHYGRVGQLALGFDWARCYDTNAFPDSRFNAGAAEPMTTQAFGLSAGAALNARLGVRVGAAYTTLDRPYDPVGWEGSAGVTGAYGDHWDYSLALSWAFGDAEHRVDAAGDAGR
jgi:hypothetical protein